MNVPGASDEVSVLEKLREDLGERPVRESLDPVRRKTNELIGEARPDRVVQVVGSNGKGSVVHYLENLLRDEDVRSVSYVSPQLHELRERIHLNGDVLRQNRFVELLESLPASVHHEFTPFERFYLATVKLAVDQEVDVLILESGMGGRWDATSALSADWTVLTSVDREHTQFLGETRAEILREQLQQIPHESGLLAPTLRDKALASLLKELVRERSLTNISIEPSEDVDRQNRSLATTLTRLLTSTSSTTLNERLRDVKRPPGRKEVLSWQDRSVILDVAHTPDALRAWIRFTREETPGTQAPLFLYGTLEGKELEELTDVLRQEVPTRNLLLTRPPSPRALSPDKLIPFWTSAGESPPEVQMDPDRAWERLLHRGKPDQLITIAGSFSLVKHFREKML